MTMPTRLPGLRTAILAAALVGCPTTPTPLVDAGTTTDVGLEIDAGASDAPEERDATGDAPATPDAGPSDAGPSDGGLPPITDPTVHAVPASEGGHDRFYAVVFAPDSSFYVAGVAADGTAATDDFRTIVGHFTAGGDLDASFGTAGWFSHNVAVGTNAELPSGIDLQSDGRIVVSETIEHAGATDARDRDVAVLRITAAGVLDPTFATGGIALLDLSDGEAEPAPSTVYSADGARNLEVDPLDRIVVAVGLKRAGAIDTDFGVLRLSPDGALDATFGTGGVASVDIANLGGTVRNLHILPDGRIVASGYYTDAGIIRPVIYALDESGVLDPAFGTGGVSTDIALALQAEINDFDAQSTGALVTSGYGRDSGTTNDAITMRFDAATGVRDLTYGTLNGVGILTGHDFGDNGRQVAVLPDDRVMLVGQLRSSAFLTDGAVMVFSSAGVPDASFGTGGAEVFDLADGIVDHFWGVEVDPRGERVVVVGIGGTTPATDDDGVVYLFPVP